MLSSLGPKVLLFLPIGSSDAFSAENMLSSLTHGDTGVGKPTSELFQPLLLQATNPGSAFSPFPRMKLVLSGRLLAEMGGWRGEPPREEGKCDCLLTHGASKLQYSCRAVYSTEYNERTCMGHKTEILSCPPQPSVGSSRVLGKHHWVCALREVAIGAGCRAWPLLGCLTPAGTSFPSCCRASLWHG